MGFSRILRTRQLPECMIFNLVYPASQRSWLCQHSKQKKLSQYKDVVHKLIVMFEQRLRGRLAVQIVILALTTDAETVANTWSQFTLLKNRGGIVNPLRSVIMICKETEKCYQWMHLEINYHRPNKHFIPTVSAFVLTEVGLNCLSCLKNHLFNTYTTQHSSFEFN